MFEDDQLWSLELGKNTPKGEITKKN